MPAHAYHPSIPSRLILVLQTKYAFTSVRPYFCSFRSKRSKKASH
jgi:hypothetical protein